ncbi:MAG: N5-carboxyaminoimidazole ribonucleotide mutase [Calditrichaeota bacterium]|nr:N5-carboxyaminoimidazole ribonucleotide mutase [Calditrichota bacterium]
MKRVAIMIGSASDREIVERALPVLDHFGIEHELRVLSAHRNAEEVSEYARGLEQRGFGVVIAAAGMANHLAGTVAAKTRLPVIGLPLPGGMLDGLDSLLSTVQMPGGVPVATVSVGKAGATNAAVLAARMLALEDPAIAGKLAEFAARGFKLPG